MYRALLMQFSIRPMLSARAFSSEGGGSNTPAYGARPFMILQDLNMHQSMLMLKLMSRKPRASSAELIGRLQVRGLQQTTEGQQHVALASCCTFALLCHGPAFLGKAQGSGGCTMPV